MAAEGVRLQRAGEHDQAVRVFLEAHRKLPVPSLLYSIARTYDHMGQLELARSYYKKFAVSDDPTPRLLGKATQRIREIDRELESQRLAKRMARRSLPEVGDPDEAFDPGDEPGGRRTGRASSGGGGPGAKPGPGRGGAGGGGGPRLAPWLLVGSGVLLVGTGLGFGVSAMSVHNDYEQSRSLGDKQELRDSAQARALTGDILVGAGVAAAVGGALWLLLVSDEPGSGGEIGWAPGRPRLGVGPAAMSLSWRLP